MAYDPNIDYMAEINKLKAINPNDPRIRELEVARQEKIAREWDKYGQYATPVLDPYGNAYVVDIGGSGYGTIGKSASGTYTLAPNQRFATEWEAQEIARNIANATGQPTGQNDIESYINQLMEAQRQSRISALSKAREQALSSLQAEEAGIKPMYYDLRNRAAAQSDIGALNFAQYMASRGIKGSASAMPEIYRQTALQGQIGALNRQEAADMADIARRRSAIEASYQADLQNTLADLESQRLQALIAARQQQEAQRIADLRAQGLTSTGELTLEGREAQAADLARRAALLAAQYYDDIQAYINTLDPNDPIVPYLYAERRKKIQAQAEQAAAQAAAANEAYQQAWKNAFETFKAVGRITSAEQAQILGLPINATVADVDIARMNAESARMNAISSRMSAEASQLRAQTAAAELAAKLTSQPEPGTIAGTFTANNIYSDAKAMQDNGVDKNQIIGYVMNSGLPEPDIAATLSRLGYTDADIDAYEAWKRPAYMGEFQRQNRY